MQKRDLIGPVQGVTETCHARLFPTERPKRFKTYAVDDSVDMQIFRTPWFKNVCEGLEPGEPAALLFLGRLLSIISDGR